MITWGIDSENRDILLAHLIQHNYLNEQRFAEAFVSGKVNIKKWGRNKIRQELKKRKISDYSIKKGMEVIDLDVYWKNLLRLTEKKIERLVNETNSYKKRMKVLAFLSTKGYETDLMNDAVNEFLQHHEF